MLQENNVVHSLCEDFVGITIKVTEREQSESKRKFRRQENTHGTQAAFADV